MATSGYDLFITEPNKFDEQICHVCKSRCEVTRNVYGPTSFTGSMAKIFRHHDVFVCPHVEQKWHEQALRLIQTIEDTPSKRLAELMKLDLQDILSEHGDKQ